MLWVDVLKGTGGNGGVGGRGQRRKCGVKEMVVVGFATEGAADGNGKFRRVEVEEALVWPICGATGPQRRGA